MSSSYKDEDAIRAELRDLTAKTRKLREELRGMISAPSKDITRALVHTQRRSKDRRGGSPDDPVDRKGRRKR